MSYANYEGKMKKEIAKKNSGSDLSSDTSLLFANKESIEAALLEKIKEADETTGISEKAKYERDEWILRYNVAGKLANQNPGNENLSFLAEQAQINLNLSLKRVEALMEQETLALKTKQAALESLKKLQRLEVLRASGNAARDSRNEIREIMTRTAQLELSDGGRNEDTRRAEYYAQALLELTMEGTAK